MTHPETDVAKQSRTELIDAASRARDLAYVPYSKFAMGAAVRTATGQIVPGSLIENVSLGLAMCAERVALFASVSTGERPSELALVSKRTADELTWPCGACLQVALELGGQDLIVHVEDTEGNRASNRLGDLLPLGPQTAASR